MKKNLKLNYCLYVRRVRMPKGFDGDCRLLKKGFLIRIEKSIPECFAMDVLIHELAHCLAWDENADEMHGASWGKAYSLVYREFLKWSEN